ncbi:MAG: hypothetical protein QM817_27895 [Archangium sp.]
MRRALLVTAFFFSLSACFDFDGALNQYCDAGRCSDGGASVGGGMGGTDAGDGGGTAMGGGTGGGGGGGGGGGASDAGVDAGCGIAAQLDFVPPMTPMLAASCSSVAKVRVLDACGAPVAGASAVPLSFSLNSSTMQLYNDSACSFQPTGWAVAANQSELDVYVLDPNPGMPSVRVDSAGLDGSVKVLTIACPSMQRACPDGTCVANDGCCNDMECDDGGVQYVCNGSRQCEPPPCTFPANCTTYDDRTASGASRTITFDSSGYSPKCMRVTTSQDVTFSGSFFLHPLQQFCGPRDVNMTTNSGNSKTVRFPTFGTYGYRCKNHPVFEQGGIRTP